MKTNNKKNGVPVTKKVDDPDDFTDIVGSCGKWQWQMFFFFFLASFPGVWHNLVMTFFSPNIDHWCARDDHMIAANVSVEQWKQTMIPWHVSDEGDIKYSHCRRYDTDYNLTHSQKYQNIGNGTVLKSNYLHNETVACHKWEYDRSFYSSTVLGEWNLVCDREWLVSVTKSVFMAGYLTAVLVFGQVSDKLGRRPATLMCVIIFLVSGITCAFSVSFVMFTIARFFVALGASGVYTIGFVILVEIVGTEYRTLFSFSTALGWSTGYVLLPGIAWLIRDWFWLQMALTLPCLSFLSLWWLAPESPRWLITHGKLDEAQVVLTRIAKINGKEVNDMEGSLKRLYNKSIKLRGGGIESGNMLDLIRTPGLWQRTINLYFNWFVNSFIYYGLSYNTNDLAGDPFINFLLSGAVEFPAYIFTIIVITKLGRRLPLMGTMVAGGIACILTVPVPEDMMWLRITLAMFGKFCITASFTIVYVYSAEIYPTVIRNAGVGTSSTCARVGSILAPFVRELGNATHPAVPLACFGGLSMASGLLVLLLPETNNCRVPDTIEEAASFGRKVKPNDTHFMENSNSYSRYRTTANGAIAEENNSGMCSSDTVVNGQLKLPSGRGMINSACEEVTLCPCSLTNSSNIPENSDFPVMEQSVSNYSGSK